MGKRPRSRRCCCWHPPLAAIQAYLLFHETLSPVQFIGFALALVGVLLARTARTGINRTGLTSAKGQSP